MSWGCHSCTFENSPDVVVCGMCETAKEIPPSASSLSGWDCIHCTFSNEANKNDCEICGELKPETIQIGRSISDVISQDLCISKEVVRAAIRAENGNINAAAANMLLGLFPGAPSPFELLSSSTSSLRTFSGVSQQMASTLLEECSNNKEMAKVKIMEAFASFSVDRFNSEGDFAGEVSPYRSMQQVSSVREVACPICSETFRSDDTSCLVLLCGHVYCRFCLISHVNARMDDVCGFIHV